MFKKLLGACVGLAMLGMAGTANATLITKIYDYDGNTFTDATGDFVGSSVTGWFTIECPAIGAGDCSSLPIANYASDVTSFSFSAGTLTITRPPFSRFSRTKDSRNVLSSSMCSNTSNKRRNVKRSAGLVAENRTESWESVARALRTSSE